MSRSVSFQINHLTISVKKLFNFSYFTVFRIVFVLGGFIVYPPRGEYFTCQLEIWSFLVNLFLKFLRPLKFKLQLIHSRAFSSQDDEKCLAP